MCLLARLAGLSAMLLAPVAGWLLGHYGATRVAVVGFLIAAAGLAAEAVLAAALSALVIASVIFVLGVATIVPRSSRWSAAGSLISRWRASDQRLSGLRRRLLRPARSPAAEWLHWPDALARAAADDRIWTRREQPSAKGRCHGLKRRPLLGRLVSLKGSGTPPFSERSACGRRCLSAMPDSARSIGG